MKVCRLCGRQNDPDELFCVAADCGVSLADVSVVDSDAVGAGAAGDGAAGGGGPDSADGAGAVGDGAAGGGGPDSDGLRAGGSGPAQEADGRTIRDGGMNQARPCALVFPWGRVPVAGELGIGREAEFSPISGRLDAFPTVSRRHAVVGTAQGRWTVRDLGSTNGTFVNRARLAEGETRAIQDGDRVGFSQSLQVQVEIAATGGARGS